MDQNGAYINAFKDFPGLLNTTALNQIQNQILHTNPAAINVQASAPAAVSIHSNPVSVHLTPINVQFTPVNVISGVQMTNGLVHLNTAGGSMPVQLNTTPALQVNPISAAMQQMSAPAAVHMSNGTAIQLTPANLNPQQVQSIQQHHQQQQQQQQQQLQQQQQQQAKENQPTDAKVEGGVKEEAVEEEEDGRTLPSGVTIEKIMHRCDRCEFTATKRSKIIQHRLEAHSTLSDFNSVPPGLNSVAATPGFTQQYTATAGKANRAAPGQPPMLGCNECDYKTQRNDRLNEHKRMIHQGVRYSCELCDYSASRQDKLTQHRNSVHIGIRYPCDLCQFSSTRKDKLKQHVQTVHEKLRYHCNLCVYQVTRRDKLKEHMQVVHQGLKFKCDVCNEEYKRPAALKKHKKIHAEFLFFNNAA